jgi:hypothetical protein
MYINTPGTACKPFGPALRLKTQTFTKRRHTNENKIIENERDHVNTDFFDSRHFLGERRQAPA